MPQAVNSTLLGDGNRCYQEGWSSKNGHQMTSLMPNAEMLSRLNNAGLARKVRLMGRPRTKQAFQLGS